VKRVHLETRPIDEIKRVFELIDTEKTGSITAAQLKEAMVTLGEHPDIAEAEVMIQEAGHTHKDRVTLSELINFLTADED